MDFVKTWDFDNGMTLYMNAGGSISVPCEELGDLDVYGKVRLENIPVGKSVIKSLKSKVQFQSNCGGHMVFYADINLLDEEGNPPKIEVIDGKYMQLPPGAYIEVEKIPATTSEGNMNEFHFQVNVALNNLVNITVGYSSFKPPTAAQRASGEMKKRGGGKGKQAPYSNIEIGFLIQKCTFNELIAELGKLMPSAVPEENGDKFMAEVSSQLGYAMEEHFRRHGRDSDLAKLGMFDVGEWEKENIGTITLPNWVTTTCDLTRPVFAKILDF